MDTMSYLALVAALTSLTFAFFSTLQASKRRDRERLNRYALEEISLRETQLKYASAMNSRSTYTAIDRGWESLHALEALEEDKAVRESETLRQRLRTIRSLQYEQLEALLRSFGEERGEQDLGQMRGLLDDRRTELQTLPHEGEETAKHD